MPMKDIAAFYAGGATGVAVMVLGIVTGCPPDAIAVATMISGGTTTFLTRAFALKN